MQVRVQNYQTSEDVSLEIKGFTVIVGKSNTGKTGLLRAIEGSMFNDTVKGAIRHGAKYTQVTVDYEGVQWVWKKGAGHNDYTITTPSGTEEYGKVGFKVPKEIQRAGFREIVVDGNKTRPQMAGWHEPIFLLNKTGKVVTEMMAAVTRLDVVNMAQRDCASALRKTKSTINLREKDLIAARAEVSKYDPLDTLPMADVDVLWDEYQELERKLQDVDRYVARYDQLTSAIDNLLPLSDVNMPAKLNEQLPRDITRLRAWEHKLSAYDSHLSALEVVEEVSVPSADFSADIQALSALDGWMTKLHRVDGRLAHYGKLADVELPLLDIVGDLVSGVEECNTFIRQVIKVGRELKGLKGQLAEVEEEIHKDSHQLSELRGRLDDCPVCGR